MIYGIGNDILEINRIKRSLEREGFERFCFSKSELLAFAGDVKKLAGCFSLKEAFSKALGTGVRGFSLTEVSALRDGLGKPYLVLEGRAREISDALSLTSHCALSDTDAYVIATVRLEGK